MLTIHHLNCATLCPIGTRIFLGSLRRMVCHCLLIESAKGLILVDTGLGMQDIAHARKRLGGHFLATTRPVLDVEETALRQIQKMGFQASDVQHIILTHLDLDHAGGLADFPDATVHIFGPEFIAAMAPATLIERMRYRRLQWSHAPKWQLHRSSSHEHWFDLECVSQLPGLPKEILMIPLPGHSLGHCGVAFQTQDRWSLHAGDAYFFHAQLNRQRPRAPMGIRWFESLMQVDEESRLYHLKRLRELSDQVDIFCSHDPADLSRFIVNREESTR